MAHPFEMIAAGKNATDAFTKARKLAPFFKGSGKFRLVQRKKLSLEAAGALVGNLTPDERFNAHKKPAGCIPLDDGRFYFFGWSEDV